MKTHRRSLRASGLLLFLGLFSLSLVLGMPSSRAVLISEDFTYPDGTLVGNNGGSGFTGAWAADVTNTVSSGTNLTVSGVTGYEVIQSGTGAAFTLNNGGGVSVRDFSGTGFEGTGSGSDVWFSVLVDNTGSGGRTGLYFDTGSNPLGSDYPRDNMIAGFLIVGADFRTWAGNGTSGSLTSTGQTLSLGETHLIIGRIALLDSGSSTISLWLDPTDVTSVGAMGAVDVSYTADFGGSITRVGVETYTNTPLEAGAVDALRVSDSFSGVVVPEPRASLLLGMAAMAWVFVVRRCRRMTP